MFICGDISKVPEQEILNVVTGLHIIFYSKMGFTRRGGG
jgi:hypothetical protein